VSWLEPRNRFMLKDEFFSINNLPQDTCILGKNMISTALLKQVLDDGRDKATITK
jgi:hypothetical protein